ncbi:aspartic proteinase 36 isoform X1 [Beta vulgaris subsp. vulgaris]|uniref:aspartic proteinase 36 isoform X1 n=1 Tax=Beta vulgaris subsp. vulgaris TaxID=3555 RepID=UPI00053F6A08|nr:aspartic proteinase 36 isoform X1 [Beta vulgaris subsp. vulgaris]
MTTMIMWKNNISFSQKLIIASIVLIFCTSTVSSSAIFSLKFRYAGTNRSLNSLKLHDTNRLQMLSNLDLPLGGTGRPDSSGLYYAKLGIGTPPKSFYVQVDTGSDITWVNCIECTECPRRGYHGIELTLYDPKDSLTAQNVSCDEPFCLEVNGGPFQVCKANESCSFAEFYGDGSSSTGYFMQDIVHYDQVSGDLQTTTANGSISFGCSAGQYVDRGSPNSDESLDGILGFGKSNSSVISQLASSGQVKKMFAHCLDGVNGGGIFAIGTIVKPRVNTTPLLQNEPHYNVNMTGVKVGNYSLDLPSNLYELGGKRGAIIDIGTTLAYLPQVVYEPLVIQILSQQPNLKLVNVQDQYTCFKYTESVDDGFPPVTFYFGSGLSMTVQPNQYFFPVDDLWCVGWQNSGMLSRDKKNLTLLGDLVLSNKLVVYDLENMVIGWTEYNCSSSIQVKDEQTGTVHLVGPHFISFASFVDIQTPLLALFIALVFTLTVN